MNTLTCIHSTSGLCPECQADYEEDPMAWAELGRHPAGEAAWKETLEKLADTWADAHAAWAQGCDDSVPL